MQLGAVSSSASSSTQPRAKKAWPLKQLLKAGYELLQPPSALSNDVQALRTQLEKCDKTLAEDVHRHEAGKWCKCDRTVEENHARETNEQLRCLVSSRTRHLLVEMQCILEKEYWPAEDKDGLLPGDCKWTPPSR